MADRKITDLSSLTAPATGDLLPIVDVSEAANVDKNKSITFGGMFRALPDGTQGAPSKRQLFSALHEGSQGAAGSDGAH